jgi:tetratricopeptide (TPR) repeat protein
MNRVVVLLAMVLLSLIVCVHAEEEKTFDQKVTKLEKQLQKAAREEKVNVLNKLSSLFLRKEPARSLGYANRAAKLAKKINYRQGKAYAFIKLAKAHWALGDNKKPFELSREALNIFEESGDYNGIRTALGTIADFYRINGNYEDALKYIFESLHVSEKMNDNASTAESLYQVGNLYLRLDEPGKALKYFQRALETGKEAVRKQRLIYYINNIGLAYMELEQYTRALDNFQKALRRFTEQGDKFGISNTLLNIGIIHIELDNFDESLQYLHQGLEKFEETGNNSGMCRALFHIGNNHFKMNQYKRAMSYYGDALKKAREANDKFMIQLIYESYSEVYAASGEYKESLKYHKLYTRVKDNLVNEKKNKQIAELQERYEAEKRKKEIEILKKTNKIRGITRNVLIAGLILVFIFLAFMFKKYMYLFSFWKKQKHIGQYRLMEPIGSGGMGKVFKAHNIRDKTSVVAIKVLKEELFKVESNQTRFKHEGAIIDKLDHPNILKIFERGIHEETLYFVMEFIEGKTLGKKIEADGQIDLKEAIHIMTQLTDALALIHSRDIVHRDLKPTNIMLTQKNGDPNFVKLLDFGLSKMKYQTRITESGVFLGTVNYLAPEQIVDFEYSPASDIYSLGIIFYEMLIGHFAFTGDSLSAIVDQVLDTTPPAPGKIRPGIPGELNRLILEMISKQTSRRPTAHIVLNTLKKLSRSCLRGS